MGNKVVTFTEQQLEDYQVCCSLFESFRVLFDKQMNAAKFKRQ